MLLFSIASLLLGTALAQLPSCEKGFTLYTQRGALLAKFPASPSPAQFAIPKALLSTYKLKLVFELCGSGPPFQSVNVTVSKNGATLTRSFVKSAPYAIAANFLQNPGYYMMTAQGHSQKDGNGLLLSSMSVKIYVYSGCQRSFVVYDTGNQKAMMRFPDFGVGSDVNATHGTIDRLQVGAVKMNMAAEFCNSQIQSVKFMANGFPIGVDNLAPFSIGGKSNGVMLPSSMMSTLTGKNVAFDAYAYSALNGAGRQLDYMRIYLTMMAPSQVVTFTLVDVSRDSNVDDTSTDIATNFHQIDLAAYPANEQFTIRANTLGPIGSVAFSMYNSLRNFSYLRVTSHPPHALGGLTLPDFQYYIPSPWLRIPGIYYLTCMPYTGFNKSGTAGSATSLAFEVLPMFHLSGFTWVDATTGSNIEIYSVAQPSTDVSLKDLPSYNNLFFEIDPTLFPATAQFAVRADTKGDVRSVEFRLYTSKSTKTLLYSQVINSFPFTFRGNTRGGSFPFQTAGAYYLEATPYTRPRKGGTAGATMSASVTIRARV